MHSIKIQGLKSRTKATLQAWADIQPGMKFIYGQSRKHKPGPLQVELPGFGATVTQADLDLWMDVMCPHVSLTRRANFVKNYRIADKVADAKRERRWPPKRDFVA